MLELQRPTFEAFSLKKLQLMRTILTLIAGLILSASQVIAQRYSFEASQMNLNVKGEKIQKTAETPTRISFDLEAMTFTIETDVAEIKTLMKEQMVRKIEKQLGEIDSQYSLRIETNTFVHFYLDSRMMIMITRDDVHPMEWGMMFKQVVPKN